MTIAIIGIGYVYLTNAALLAQHHEVVVFDLSADKTSKLSQQIISKDK